MTGTLVLSGIYQWWAKVDNHGSRLAEGSPAEIRAHPEVIAAYLGKSDLAARGTLAA